jgi:mannose-binding lectin 2
MFIASLQTVQLRTHSIFAPYIDQDLQNRWWDFGADSYVVSARCSIALETVTKQFRCVRTLISTSV